MLGFDSLFVFAVEPRSIVTSTDFALASETPVAIRIEVFRRILSTALETAARTGQDWPKRVPSLALWILQRSWHR